jgi:endogenous inhibitor of DNA gyrase (YacG/DUF329 family)
MSEAPRCAYCRERPVAPAWTPFCSERCKMADLGRWLTGRYRIAGPPADPPAEAAAGIDDEEPDDAADR